MARGNKRFDDRTNLDKRTQYSCYHSRGHWLRSARLGYFRTHLYTPSDSDLIRVEDFFAVDVRVGSKADIGLLPIDVRFTPESGHCRVTVGCLLCARSRHPVGDKADCEVHDRPPISGVISFLTLQGVNSQGRAQDLAGATMTKSGDDDKVYPVAKLAVIVDALAVEGISPADALEGVRLSKEAIASPATRVSLNQVIECYRNADRLSRDPYFAYNAGLRLHVSAYGMYGFAILSSMSYRQTMQFAMQYHQLATPLTTIDFSERDGYGGWTITPLPNVRVDARLYKFLVEMQFGIFLSLHRDIMGPSFAARELHVTYGPPADAPKYLGIGSLVLFGQSENRFLFDAAWLDGTPNLGNEITYSTVVGLCDGLMEEFRLHIGLIGKVRQALMTKLMRATSFDDIANSLNMSPRTLRRRLREENTSFRKLVDELRMDMAIKYLRDTNLTVEDIAEALGFSDAANFRHAFRRWTKAAPHDFRGISGRA
jgi:AraC-like DNA-binding protein